MPNRVLVTGGAGFIGSHTCKALAAAGFLPVAFDDLSSGARWPKAIFSIPTRSTPPSDDTVPAPSPFLLRWRQQDLSKASGVGTATVRRIEKSERDRDRLDRASVRPGGSNAVAREGYKMMDGYRGL
jgi:nucleoside-diphosphate-sugar epimerase